MNPIALYKVSYGLYVVCSVKDNKLNGQIANTVTQVTAEPPQVTIALNTDNLTHDFIQSSGVFSVSVLSQITPMTMIGTFGFHSGRETDKFESIQYKIGQTGAPIIEDYTIAFLEAKVSKEMNVGSHTIFVGDVIDAQILNDHEPMTYAYYHLVKGGKSPKNAPTYIENVTEVETGHTAKCDICGYVYHPEKGDPGSDVQPGTSFDSLTDSWKCPVCNAEKTKFQSQSRQKNQLYKCAVCGYIYDPAKGDPNAGIQPGTAFESLPEDWRCPVCRAAKTEFKREN